MKFVALALALLLAVSCQGASLQADAPSQLAHVRAAMDVYLTQVKDSAKRALDQLDDAEYKELKDQVSQRLEDMHTQIKALQVSVAPVTDSVVKTIADATAGLRASLEADFETLKAELEPKRAALREVIERHVQDYQTQLEPVITEYYAKHTAEMDALRTRMEPIVEELRAKVATNLEETKAAALPIVEALRTKISERLEELKGMAKPYVDEYKDQMKQAYDQARGVKAEDLSALREKIAPLAEEVKGKLQQMAEIVMASFQS
ncbi:apolipoprotein A-I-like [Scomber scombrus]|uniref:Apolipoprotein A-I-like n=1 Tax=Scomber scombrus TaxID=13677 RepID=A0AAV1PVL8_SCOSC|nr:apolipoprotein A-I-like [Scomber scombrus]